MNYHAFKKFFTEADTSENKKVDFEEFKAFIEKHATPQQAAEIIADVKKQVYEDENGEIDEEMFAEIMKGYVRGVIAENF